MNDRLHQAVSHVLDYLLALQEARTQPREARAQLQTLRALHPDLQIDLLAEEEAFDQSIHYDALIQSPGEGTVSLSYCPERVVPWPLRGVHRWREGDLVRVNANVLPVDAAMACLDFIWDEAPTIERLVNMCLIQEELDRQPIDLNDAELQQAMNQFRAAKKLFKTDDTLRWLERHGMTHEKLERYVADRAIVPKLRDRITADPSKNTFGSIRLTLTLPGLHASICPMKRRPANWPHRSVQAPRTSSRFLSAFSSRQRIVAPPSREICFRPSSVARQTLGFGTNSLPPRQVN